jgi:3-oxoadipate enol-lactonase
MAGRPEHGAIDVGGLRLAHQVWGAPCAPPLVLLHALGEGGADWADVAAAFAGHWRVYAPDLRGHGRSDWPGDYSLDAKRGDVLGFMDALELGRVDLIGHSMGGLVACLVAEDQPERVARLVLEDIAALQPRKRELPARPDGHLPYDWEMVLAVRSQIDNPDPAWFERLGRISAQTLVIGGGPASPIPQDRVAELARRIPGARHETIPAGHLIHAALPDTFIELAMTFLRRRPRVSEARHRRG